MSQTILLVEDNEDNRTIYRTFLEHVGYAVVEAVDGEEAVQRARENGPDLILMDVSIPRMDGWTATGILKSDPATAHIPVIALTAHALAQDRERAREVGCDGYLAKPVTPREVIEEIRRFLPSPEPKPPGPAGA
ncbi:MAG TPA: response regulator [Longimicrobiaceae bacterium]|nr:response regulator [Longimicrobiaceae bacterium]